MADPTSFLVSYPEFGATDPAIVAAKMAEAQRQLDTNSWTALGILDDGVYLLTAQKLARTPSGNAAKLSTMSGATVYDAEFERLAAQVVGGYRVT